MSTSTQLRQGDPLVSLKEDQLEPSFKEKTMIDMLYQELPEIKEEYTNPNPTNNNANPNPATNNIVNTNIVNTTPPDYKEEIKELLIPSALFVFLNLPFTDELITKLTKLSDPNYRVAIKVALFAVILFLIRHFKIVS